MKVNLIVFILPLLIFHQVASAQEAPASSAEVIKAACNEAAEQKKNVFIIFSASWCGWCHRMDSAMNDNHCKTLFNDNYVIRHLIVMETPANKKRENPGAIEMLQAQGTNQGIPYWMIFDSSGKLLADSQIRPAGAGSKVQGTNCGYPGTKEEIEFFLRVLQQTSPLNIEELAIIKERFQQR